MGWTLVWSGHVCHRWVLSLPPLESDSKCEDFVMLITSTLHMNEN